MKIEFKQTMFSFGVLYAITVAMALLGRIGLAILDAMGGITYGYIAASTGPIMAQLCSVFTGAQLYGSMCAMGLMCGLFAASVIVLGMNFAKHKDGRTGSLSVSLVWGLITAIVGLACLAFIILGTLSAVQLASMKLKLTIDGEMVLMLVLAVLAIGTMLAAASNVVYACVATAKDTRSLGIRLIVSSVLCGFVVVLLTVFTFNTVNATELVASSGAAWFGIDTVVNVVMALVAIGFVKKGLAR